MRKLTIAGIALVAAAVVWGACAYWNVGGQRKLFVAEGELFLNDYFMPWKCAHEGFRQSAPDIEYESPDGRTLRMGSVDRCYPAFALLPYLALPYSLGAAVAFSAVCAGLFLLSLVIVGRGSAGFLALAGSMPFIFTVERGNPVFISAACVGLFLAWWDSESRRRRIVAALCLAVATVMKISPVLLGLLYLFPREKRTPRDWTSVFIAASTVVVLFLVPWMAMPGGFSAIPEFVENAHAHSDYIRQFADFGFISAWRALRLALGLDVHAPWAGMTSVAVLSQIAGVVSVCLGAWKRNHVLLVGGLLMAAGNMYYYGALYLVPVFVLRVMQGRLDWIEWILWTMILCPLQIVVIGFSANDVLCNFAVLALMGLSVLELVLGRPVFALSERREVR